MEGAPREISLKCDTVHYFKARILPYNALKNGRSKLVMLILKTAILKYFRRNSSVVYINYAAVIIVKLY